MSDWQYVEYKYPVAYNFDKHFIWLSSYTHVYFAMKLNESDNWRYYSGTASHSLNTGNLLVNYGDSSSSAQTNYLLTDSDSNKRVLAILPIPMQAKYIRLYIDVDFGTTIYEWKPSTYLLADEITAGTLTITDELTSSPIIKVTKSSIDRVKIGNFESTTYGIVGYDDSSNKVFELSDSQNMIGGLSITDNTIETTDYVAGPLGKGWSIGPDEAVFQNIEARGKIKSVVFEKDSISSIGGNLLINKSDTLSSDMTASDTSTLTISGDVEFEVNEIIRIKSGDNDEWLRITSIASKPTYSVARDLAGSYGPGSNPIWKEGSVVISYSVVDGGFINLGIASDDTSPVLQIFKRDSTTYNDYGEYIRIGNLNGFLDYVTDKFGIGIGTDQSYLKYDPTNGLRLKGTIEAIQITGGEIIGSTFKTSTGGKRIVIDSTGIALTKAGTSTTYGSFKYDDGTEYGGGIVAWINNTDESVPFYINSEETVADFHYYPRSSDPSGAAEIGDTCVVNGKLKVCTAGGTPGTWTICGEQTA